MFEAIKNKIKDRVATANELGLTMVKFSDVNITLHDSSVTSNDEVYCNYVFNYAEMLFEFDRKISRKKSEADQNSAKDFLEETF